MTRDSYVRTHLRTVLLRLANLAAVNSCPQSSLRQHGGSHVTSRHEGGDAHQNILPMSYIFRKDDKTKQVHTRCNVLGGAKAKTSRTLLKMILLWQRGWLSGTQYGVRQHVCLRSSEKHAVIS